MASTRPIGGLVVGLEPGAATEAGLKVGDMVLAVDGAPVRDVLDWWWLTEEPVFDVDVERQGRRLSISVERTPGEPLGVSFDGVVFDGVKECENSCAFCFVSQLPGGLRDALYVRDDDYRLSFIAGNFVTLTNLTGADVARILEQRLSPLHVSIHAVDLAVRAELICPTVDDRALEIADVLLGGGIEFHVQVVLVPGLNDADVLEKTLAWLAERRGIASVGIVPIGYTAHQVRWSASFSERGAQDLIAQIAPWQERMRRDRGIGWVYAADEFYLRAGFEIPSASGYDDFPQYENGIGMVRSFIDDVSGVRGATARATLVTGELFAPVLEATLARHDVRDVRVLPVANRLFGGNVSVAGLLGGSDIAEAIARDGDEGPYLVPDVVVNSDELLLDDVPADRLGALTGRDVRIVGSDGAALVAALELIGRQART